MKIGLTLLKAAPLHNGHLFLIERALELVDELIVVVYDCPDKTSVPLPRRCDWVRKIFPSRVTVIEGYDAPNVHQDTQEVKRIQEKYAESILAGKKISYFISSEYYGEHMSEYLGAKNIIIDLNRGIIPISSTKIRNDFLGNLGYLPEIVAHDLLIPRLLIVPPRDFCRNIASEELLKLNLGILSPQRYSFNKIIASEQGFNEELNKSKGGERERSGSPVYFEASPMLSMHAINLLRYRRFDQGLQKLSKDEILNYEDIIIDRGQFLSQKNDQFSGIFLKSVIASLEVAGKYFRYIDSYENVL